MTLLAGTRFSGFVEQEWPGFQLASQKIDLDTLYTGILEDSWLVLVNGDRFEALQVENVSDGSRRDFLLDTTITSIIPTAPVTTPSNFSLRTTTVLVQSEQLAMAQESLSVSSQQTKIFLDPISNNNIYLSEFVQGLENGQSLIVVGKHPRAKVKLGGMARSQDWNGTNAELEERIIQALSIIPGGYLLVGTDKGVNIFSSDDKGITWKSISEELSSQNITSFVTTSEKGTGTIVGNGTNILGRNTIFSNQLQAGDFITVEDKTGTVKNIQTTAVKNIQSNEELEINKVFSISINGKSFTINKLFAGTAQGIFRFRADTLKWEQVNQQELQNIQTLAIKEVKNSLQLLAGTREHGVFRSQDYGRNWKEITDGLTDQNIRSLLVNLDNGQIFAGTANHGIFRLIANGNLPNDSDHFLNFEFKKWSEENDEITAVGQSRTIRKIISDTELIIDEKFNTDIPKGTPFTRDILFAGTAGQTQVKIATTTVLGSTTAGNLEARDSIFNEQVTVTRRQKGCVRFCYVPDGSQTPPRYQCQPDLILEEKLNPLPKAIASLAIENRSGHLFVGTAGDGIYHSLDQDKNWIKIKNSEISAQHITSLIAYAETLAGTIISQGTTVTGRNTAFTKVFQKEDAIIAHNQVRTVDDILSDTNLTVNASFDREAPLPETSFSIPHQGKGKVNSDRVTLSGQGTAFTTELKTGDTIVIERQERNITNIISNSICTIDSPWDLALNI